MKKTINYIISLLLAAMFLVSFTGVRLLVHHCMSSGTSEIVFASDVSDCCENSAHHKVKALPAIKELSCCAPTAVACDLENQTGCCDFESIYLKGDYDLVVEKAHARVDIPGALELFLFAGEMIFENYTGRLTAAVSYVDPPPRPAGRTFVLYTHQMKIGRLLRF